MPRTVERHGQSGRPTQVNRRQNLVPVRRCSDRLVPYGIGVPATHLLVVEDDEALGANLLQALCGQGYDARWVRSGREARATTFPPPDLVLLDLGLPDVDGVVLCRELHAEVPAPSSWP